jgi:DNA mismatch endonuclease, patch repair protein
VQSEARFVTVERGVRVPYPEPTSAGASAIGRANRRTDTKPERLLRSSLHVLGLRFRVDLRIKEGATVVRPDVVFTRRRIAVFVDGCFWHRCPRHFHAPKTNLAYWGPKLDANVRRDRRVTEALTAGGWHVERIWEHEDMQEAAERIRALWLSRE